MGRSLNALCQIRLLSTHRVSISFHAFAALLEILQNEGYSSEMRQSVPHTGINMPSYKHTVCLGMAGMERGDKSFSCSKKVAASYMGTTGRYGGSHWVPFLHITCGYTQLTITHTWGLAGPGCPQHLQPGCSLPQLSHLRWEPSHLTASSLPCVVQVKHRLSGKPQLTSQGTFYTTACYLCPAGCPGSLQVFGQRSSGLALSHELLGMLLLLEVAIFPSSLETVAGI